MSERKSRTGVSRVAYVLLVAMIVLILGIALSILAIITYQENDLQEVFKPRPPRQETPILVISEPEDGIKNGVDIRTGLIASDGWEMVRANCTACHSAKLITQNRQTREGWKDVIEWMQETQGLWDLGDNEEIILDYLAKNYSPEEKGRRANLKNIEWYMLNGNERENK